MSWQQESYLIDTLQRVADDLQKTLDEVKGELQILATSHKDEDRSFEEIWEPRFYRKADYNPNTENTVSVSPSGSVGPSSWVPCDVRTRKHGT